MDARGDAPSRRSDGEGPCSRRLIACGLLALALALTCSPLVATTAQAAGKKGAKGKRAKGKSKKKKPNLLVVMTDDQDMASLPFMPKLQRLMVRQGTSFSNAITNNSFCCPSRATYFTGQYSKNHGVLSNAGPLGGYQRLAPTVANTLPVWLKRAGYHTGLVGEFLLGYDSPQIPPGWDEWFGTYGQGAYGYLMNENGRIVLHGTTPAQVIPKQYSTDVYANKAVGFIKRNAARKKPFYLTIAPFAAHAEGDISGTDGCACTGNNPRAAPRDEGVFSNVPLPKPPNYNEADVSDKPSITRNLPAITPDVERLITESYRARLESLLAVDDMVGRMVKELKKKHALKNTVILFTTDNGWMKGENRWAFGKVLPYESSIHVPLIIRGPGVSKNAVRQQVVSNVDIAPTLLDFARGRAGRPEDGRSLRPLLRRGNRDWHRPVLLEGYYNQAGEYGPDGRIIFQGVRTDRYMFARYENGDEELYDLQSDPFELQSLALNPAFAGLKSQLSGLLAQLQKCAGRSCSSVSFP